MERDGIPVPTVEAYNSFTAEYHALNVQKETPDDAARLAATFKRLARDLNSSIEQKIDFKVIHDIVHANPAPAGFDT